MERNNGQFQLGHKINLERVWTKESRDKLSKSNKGKHHSTESEFKKGKVPQRDFSEKRNEFLRIINLGNDGCKGYKHNEENIKKIKEARARQVLPLIDTSIEIKIQDYLKRLRIEFYTHQFIPIEHSYCCDIIIPSKRLIIETDGNYFHNYPTGNEVDIIRNKELRENGYRILRLWESEIRVMQLDDLQNKLVQMEII